MERRRRRRVRKGRFVAVVGLVAAGPAPATGLQAPPVVIPDEPACACVLVVEGALTLAGPDGRAGPSAPVPAEAPRIDAAGRVRTVVRIAATPGAGRAYVDVHVMGVMEVDGSRIP